jgi:hypothetical protein
MPHARCTRAQLALARGSCKHRAVVWPVQSSSRSRPRARPPSKVDANRRKAMVEFRRSVLPHRTTATRHPIIRQCCAAGLRERVRTAVSDPGHGGERGRAEHQRPGQPRSPSTGRSGRRPSRGRHCLRTCSTERSFSTTRRAPPTTASLAACSRFSARCKLSSCCGMR